MCEYCMCTSNTTSRVVVPVDTSATFESDRERKGAAELSRGRMFLLASWTCSIPLFWDLVSIFHAPRRFRNMSYGTLNQEQQQLLLLLLYTVPSPRQATLVVSSLCVLAFDTRIYFSLTPDRIFTLGLVHAAGQHFLRVARSEARSTARKPLHLLRVEHASSQQPRKTFESTLAFYHLFQTGFQAIYKQTRQQQRQAELSLSNDIKISCDSGNQENTWLEDDCLFFLLLHRIPWGLCLEGSSAFGNSRWVCKLRRNTRR